jgi:hypothetical protein
VLADGGLVADVYTSDDIIVQPALVAAGTGVTTVPGLALRTHQAGPDQASRPATQAGCILDYDL